MTGETEDRVVITEHLNNERYVDLFAEPPYSIDVIGHWQASNHEKLVVGVAQSEIENFEEMKGTVENLLSVNQMSANDSRMQQYGMWNDLLSSNANQTNVPTLSFVGNGSGHDILIRLTAEPHPNGKTTAETILRLDGKTIESSEIIIYHANQLYIDGEFITVLQHELGHAIGLGHSNYFGSVMYPSLVIINEELVGAISDCEAQGVELAYSSNAGKVECMTSST